MEKIKEFYNSYQYPKSKAYVSNQIRTHRKTVLNILETACLNEKDILGKTVLDAGCGTGEKSIFFAKGRAKKVVAIDFSFGQLQEAKKKARDLDNIVFLEKDILKDDLKNLGKFDIIFCVGVLHHTEKPRKAFERIVALLKTDGIIIIGLYHKYSRLRYRLQRWLLRTFISKEPDTIINYLYKTKRFHDAPRSTLYDRYCVPYERYHTLREVTKWFNESKIRIIGQKNIRQEKLEVLNIFEKKTIFFVAGKKI